MDVCVIFPAAGLGTRMATGQGAGSLSGQDKPQAAKQYMTLGGVPVLVHSLRAFAAVPRVTEMLVAVRASEMDRLRELLAEYGLAERVRVVEGGEHRQGSVANALAASRCGENDVVLVHDAVRPLIDPATIEKMIDAVERHGAAIVAMPAVDTIKQVERTADGALVSSTIPRERVVHAQTPQGARCGLLRRAFAEAAADGFAGTDESGLLERAGIEVHVVPGLARNFKITQPGDLALAEFFLSSPRPNTDSHR